MEIKHRAPRMVGVKKKKIRTLPENTTTLALTYLNRKLDEKGKNGKVVTVLTYNEASRRIACYGEKIDDGRIFSVLNLNTTRRISHPHWHRLCHWSQGFFIPLSAFLKKETLDWVALVGIGISHDTDLEVIPFRR